MVTFAGAGLLCSAAVPTTTVTTAAVPLASDAGVGVDDGADDLAPGVRRSSRRAAQVGRVEDDALLGFFNAI